jgi:protein SCO1
VRRLVALLGVMVLAMPLALAGVGTARAHELTPTQLSMVRFDQKLGDNVPASLRFRDEDGRSVTLGEYLGQRPAILTLNYFHCQNLCPIELDGVVNGLNGVPLTLGQDFTLLTVSIDPREGPADAADAKSRAIRGYDRPQDASGWHVLTGDQASIDALTDAVGFRFAYDAAADDFAHPAGVVLLTADGRISRYLYGFDFAATDLRLALLEAGEQRIGSLADRALLVCYHYDPLTGRYTPLALDLVRIGGVAGVVALVGLVGFLWRSERRRKPTAPTAS